jgi:sugar phosphate isomerase/epimerase
MPMTRRAFLQTSASAAALLAAPSGMFANPLGMPIGCQTYPVKDMIKSDFPGTLKFLSGAGFQTIELCSPFAYPEFLGLGKYKPKELRGMLADNGLKCISAHWVPTELYQHGDERIEYAKEFGMTQMAVALLGPFKITGKETVDDVKRYTDQFNAFAVKAHAAGIAAVLHNEGFVSERIDGKPVYDMMIEQLDPTNVKLQFQVSSMQVGYDPVEYFHKYKGRYISMHCQDWVKDPSTKSGFRQVALGKGVVDWPKVFAAAKIGGIQNYFVELEEDPQLLPPSVPYLKSLHV